MSGAKAAEERRLALLAQKALRSLGVRGTAPAVFLLPDREMRHWKARFFSQRAKPGTADVLAFPEPRHFPHPESRRRVLGEIYLNRDLKGSPERRVYLLLHGLLHLLGYTHRKKDDILKMEKLERKLMKRFLKKSVIN